MRERRTDALNVDDECEAGVGGGPPARIHACLCLALDPINSWDTNVSYDI